MPDGELVADTAAAAVQEQPDTVFLVQAQFFKVISRSKRAQLKPPVRRCRLRAGCAVAGLQLCDADLGRAVADLGVVLPGGQRNSPLNVGMLAVRSACSRVLGSRIEAQFISFLLSCSMPSLWRQWVVSQTDYHERPALMATASNCRTATVASPAGPAGRGARRVFAMTIASRAAFTQEMVSSGEI
jgi:hypothetical protein